MPRDIPIGNGNILVAFDSDYLLREFCFPHVGEENHTNGRPFRIGVWANGQFSWVPHGWKIRKDYLDDSLVTHVELRNDTVNIRIVANDVVDFHENIYLKKLTIENLSNEKQDVRLFFVQDFCLKGNEVGDTAAFRPDVKGVLHYKNDSYFLVNIFANGKYGIDHFATGNKSTGALEGTWRDAEDGELSNNSIAQGAVDSVVGMYLTLSPLGMDTCYYWISVGEHWERVKTLNELVKKKTPEGILKRTFDYWKLWVNKENLNYSLLPDRVAKLYKRSLLICRTQINNCGSIIAANDSEVILFNRDTYSYMWPRDGALVAYGLDCAGYCVTSNFYILCSEIIEKEGYFLHKYTPSGALASSWHPWLKNDKPQLPIQEDETALVVWALWNHYQCFKDVEFIKPLYKPLIKRAADFMMNYRDLKTGLPLPSYDLWEERQGILTFTVSAVYGGLVAAAKFAEAFGELDLAHEYRDGALKMREGMDTYLYMEGEKRFARMVNFGKNGSIDIDPTIDASLYGIFAFGAYDPNDAKVKTTMEQVEGHLWNKEGGGLARYEGDSYYREGNGQSGNSWFVTTLWLAQYYIAIAENKEDLLKALLILEWVVDHALPSGVLAEQIDPKTGKPLSVSPLTWSHGTYIAALQEYLNKLLELAVCPVCSIQKFLKT